MSDLVERLRAEAKRSEIHGTLEAASLLMTAADDIENLTKLHKEAVAKNFSIVARHAEVTDKLRAALKNALPVLLYQQIRVKHSSHKPDWFATIDAIVDEARAALAEAKGASDET